MKCLICSLLPILIGLMTACHSSQSADLILYNGHLITMEDSLAEASVVVVQRGKILDTGGEELLNRYHCPESYKIDLKGQYLYPGFIDAHCHFYGYAQSLLNCDLTGTRSWEEVLERVKAYAQNYPTGWIVGRGWDQNDWAIQTYPDNAELSRLFPERPVILRRVDGHAAIANAYALQLAGITLQTKVNGGEILQSKQKLTGILIDNAVDLVTDQIPERTVTELKPALKEAEQQCYALGLTTLADAGLDVKICKTLDSLSEAGDISIYLYLMLNPTEEGLAFARKGMLENDRVRISSFKLYADGALGSRGAKLKRPYCDRDGHTGLLIQAPEYYQAWCQNISELKDFQVNTHCIGDSAVSLVLRTYASLLPSPNDKRWRIEHAQVVDPNDLALFSRHGIVPSVQPTHAVSDGPWADKRLCTDRMPGAYDYKDLLRVTGYLPLGTDFPVESPDPLLTWYAAVYRAHPNQPGQQYESGKAITQKEALKGITIWAAKGCKLEHRKGSIRTGKDADFVVLNKDLTTCTQREFGEIQRLATYRNGKLVYELKK
jgi:predicted amidohydrolase YtcJ